MWFSTALTGKAHRLLPRDPIAATVSVGTAGPARGARRATICAIVVDATLIAKVRPTAPARAGRAELLPALAPHPVGPPSRRFRRIC